MENDSEDPELKKKIAMRKYTLQRYTANIDQVFKKSKEDAEKHLAILATEMEK